MLSQKINQARRIKRNIIYWFDDTKRLLLQPFSDQDFVNQKEIRIVGLKRSGNHGIITWIRHHYNHYVWHLNKISPMKNPYRNLYEHYAKEDLKREAEARFSYKECLIYNHENYILESLNNSILERKHDLYIGKSKTRYDLLILRDPYNTFASMLQGQKNNNKFSYIYTFPDNKKIITELWLDYAKEFLGETNYLKHTKIMINYNHWVKNQTYRKSISKKLDLDFCDTGFNIVKNYGGGSSFDGTKLTNQVDKMDILTRWRNFVNDEEYKKMLSPEIIEYSHKIFGHIEGTEALIN